MNHFRSNHEISRQYIHNKNYKARHIDLASPFSWKQFDFQTYCDCDSHNLDKELKKYIEELNFDSGSILDEESFQFTFLRGPNVLYI